MSEGPVVKRFEKALAALYGIDEIMCTNSCTSALQIAFRCIDIQPGDEVISTPLTCVATNMPLYQMGARIIWADVDSISGMVSASQVERLITSKTKAIVLLHKEGDVFERSKIKKLAYFHNLPVVEDCAHILNSTEANIQVPEDADFACFSYQAIKHLNTGDGGSLYCAPKYRNLARKFKWFGIDRNKRESGKWLEDITVDGYKMNMNDVTASIGLAQLQTMEDKWHTNYFRGYFKRL